jgi:UDP-N-acetylmuramyl pentapeptide phosphotransferase/UDP-N-acetylglucosamine-1-phosphate transferase
VRGVAVLAFLLTLGITPLAIWVLRRLQVMDVPSERSSHVVHTPRGGGIGVFLGAVSGVVLAGTAGVVESGSIKTLLVCASFFAVVGLIDDIKTLEVKPRLLAQLACAVIFVGPWFYQNGPFQSGGVRVVMSVAAVVWVMGYLNAFNFMDGINGISGFHAVLAGGVFALIGYHEHHRIVELCGLAIAAAAAGFLPYNFPRARVFLGDVGSYFIGTWIAISALIALVWQAPPEAVFAPLAVYLADTAYTLVDRVRRGENWRQSHRDHVYQQLVDRGWSHARTTVLVTCFSALCALLGLFSLVAPLGVRLAADAAIPLVLVGYLLMPRLAARWAAAAAAGPLRIGADAERRDPRTAT